MLNIDLFKGISEAQMLELLQCLGIKTKAYKKDSIIVPFDKEITAIGVILAGSVRVLKKDVLSGTTATQILQVNDIFSQDVVCAKTKKSPISVIADSNCEVLFLEYDKIMSFCEKNCAGHKKVIENLMQVIAKKNIELSLQMELLGKKTIREKLLTYLKTYMAQSQSSTFFIPYNRNELAHFLCTDRSAMSRELCNMRDDGLLKFNKNYFEILN